MKILILSSYYCRPILVRNMLNSLLRAHKHHQDWELAFGDDGSKIPGRPIVEEVLKDHLDKVTFVHSEMTIEEKIDKGLILGKLANEQIRRSNADIALVLQDDDELVETHLKDLSYFFETNPDVLYCYSKIHLFNPMLQKTEGLSNLTGKYNQWSGPINPVNKVDATQVAWRLKCCKEYGAWFKDDTLEVPGKPWTKDTDKSFFENLYEKCGECHPSGLVAQYKGVHDYQLLWHKNVGAESLREYDKMVTELGGIKF